MSKTPAMDRRKFIKTGSSLLAFSTVSAVAPLNADTVWNGLQGLDVGRALVLYRDSDPQAQRFAAAFADAGIAVLALGHDPVRQWRDGLGQLISEQKLMITGMGNWVDYIIVRRLAAEQRQLPLLEMQHVRTQDRADWAHDHAATLIQACACDRDSLRTALRALEVRGNINTAAPSVFSWVLA